MQIKFIGAVERVTGSCTWVKTDNVEFLVDCGMVQGERHDQHENTKKFEFKPKNIKFILLTHAHLDHCGLIPRLYREGFAGRVLCTKATAKLAKEILRDSAKISNRIYDEDDVNKVNFSEIDNGKNFKWGILSPIDNNIFIALYRNSHILGSVSYGIICKKDNIDYNILFTGDIGQNTRTNNNLPLLKHRHELYQKYNYVVCESTYGSRASTSIITYSDRIEFLKNVIIKTILIKR